MRCACTALPAYGRARLVAAGSWPGTFKSILSSLPSSPAASPAALAATGGLAGMAPKLAAAGGAKSGHAGPAKTPEVASLALPARVHRVGCYILSIGLFPALLEERGWSADIVDL